jgi:membrane protein DedA with SNARE-associated domain
MADLYTLLAQYGLAITFASVLLARLGIPLPTLPVLLVAGAMATEGLLSAPLLLLAATSAAMAADTAWYLAGRWYGLRVLRLLCSISLSPDGCVRQAESVYLRHEALSLVASKFVPGLSTVAAPMAGAWQLPFVRFTRYNAIGALAWAGLGIGAGMIFHGQIDGLIVWVAGYGTAAVQAAALLLASFIGWKWWQRRRFFRALRMARVTAADLRRMIADGMAPLVLDVRTPQARTQDGRRFPGAIEVDPSDPEPALAGLSPDREVAVFCT